jgi:hypothetical protein
MFFFWQLARSVWPRCILPSFDKAEKCCCIWYNHNKGGASVTVQGLNYLCISSHGHFFSTWSRRTRVIQLADAHHHAQKWNISRFETTIFKFRHSNKSAFEKFFIIRAFFIQNGNI